MNRNLVDKFGRYRTLLIGRGAEMTPAFTDLLVTKGSAQPFDPSIIRVGGKAPTWDYGDGNSATGDIPPAHYYGDTIDYTVSWNLNPSFLWRLYVNADNIQEINTRLQWVNLAQLICSSNSLTDLKTFDTWTKLEIFYCNQNNLSGLETFASWTDMEYFWCSDNNLTSLEAHSSWTEIISFYCENNSLPASEIDGILIAIDATGAINGTLWYQNNLGSADIDRSGAAATAKADLITKGWIIIN